MLLLQQMRRLTPVHLLLLLQDTCQEQEGGRSLQEDVADDSEGGWEADCQEEQCCGQLEALLPLRPGLSGQDVRDTHGSSYSPWGSPLY